MKLGRNVVRKTTKKLPRWGQKSAIKLILRLRNFISKKGLPTKTISFYISLYKIIWSVSECYITYHMDFRFVPSDPVCFDKLSRCDFLAGKWECVGAGRSSRCVTGRRPRDMRTTRSGLDMYHIHNWRYVRNGHIIIITIEHRNLGIRQHVTTSCSGTKPFY